jgi:hypothetical protein
MGTSTDMTGHTARSTGQHAVGIGVSIDALEIRTSGIHSTNFAPVHSESGTPDETQQLHREPPLVLLPRVPGEPVRIDSTLPRHPRCAGDVWPPEQRELLAHGSFSDWLPLALAWADFVSGPHVIPTDCLENTLYDEELSIVQSVMGDHTSAEVIAAAVKVAIHSQSFSVSQLVADPATNRRQPIVVIPNTLPMSRQQALIEACRQAGVEAKLIWRPVAAALAWCEEYESHIVERSARLEHSNQVGNDVAGATLLCLHLGLSEFEITLVDLVDRVFDERTYLVPARRRPNPHRDVTSSFGIDLVASVQRANSETSRGTPSEHWCRMWSQGQIRELLKRLNAPHDESSLCVVDLLTRGYPSANRQLDGDFCNHSSRGYLLRDFFEWLDTAYTEVIQPRIASNSLPTLRGVVVTGELSRSMYDESQTLWACCLERLGVAERELLRLIDDPLEEGRIDLSVAARGAMQVSQRLHTGKSAWLDTLPQLRTATYQNRRAEWLDLLQGDDVFVEGGRVWRRPEPVKGLSLQAGRHSLEVPVWHEEFPTVRTVSAEFDRPLDTDVAVELDVQIEPAQGNARIEVRPVESDQVVEAAKVGSGRSMRTLWLEWSRMKDEGATPEEWLRQLPTSYPPPMYRSASRAKWYAAKSAMTLFVQTGSLRQLFTVIQLLQQRIAPDETDGTDSNMEARATAVSSDGQVPDGDPEALDRYVSHLLHMLAETTKKPSGDVLRGLAYSSTAHPHFQDWLSDRIRKATFALSQQELAACGWCLRRTDAIASLANVFAERLERDSTGHNNWLKALAEILRYREDACQEIATEVCEQLVTGLIRVFEQQLARRNTQILFRNSALCIVYLLRRREYDDSFLEPDSALTNRVRDAFVEAIDMIRSRRTRTIGGSINLDRALQTMIDYIDRKGPALLTASGFQELAD